jgi:hypothetical protein
VSSLLFPALPGIGFDVVRNYQWKTAVQEAISGKQTAVGLRQYPLVHYELVINLMRHFLNPSELLQIQGLYNQMQGRADTFLYNDPDFNTVTLMPFAVPNGTATAFQTTATFQNTGGPGGAEIIQNFNGTPTYYLNRFGFNEQLAIGLKQNLLLQSQALDNASWTKTNVTITPNTVVAPDGTTTMDYIVESTSTNVQHIVSQSVTVPSGASIYTVSFFVKPNARNWVLLNIAEATGGTTVNAWFNISTGAIGTIQTGANWASASATITAVPDDAGVYRISLTATKTNAATVLTIGLYSSTGDTISTYTGTATTIATVAWGAQFENFNFASLYVPTTTAIVSQTDYTLGVTGIITTGFTPNANSLLSWSGSFYYRCRFDDDEVVWTKFMYSHWMVKKLGFTSVKL